MEGGWIRLDRGITEHWLWDDPELLKWWLDLIMLAARKDESKLIGGKLQTVRRGQMLASVDFLCERWAKRGKQGKIIRKPGVHRVLNFIRLLEESRMITREFLQQRRVTLVTICEYDSYQIDGDTIGNGGGNGYGNGYGNDVGNAETACECDGYILKNDTIGNGYGNGYGNDVGNGSKEKENFPPHPLYKEKENSTTTTTKAQARACEGSGFVDELKGSPVWLEQMAMKFHIAVEEVVRRLDDFALDCRCRGASHGDLNDARRHYNDWLRIQLEAEKKQKTSGYDYKDTRAYQQELEYNARQEHFKQYLKERFSVDADKVLGDVQGQFDVFEYF